MILRCGECGWEVAPVVGTARFVEARASQSESVEGATIARVDFHQIGILKIRLSDLPGVFGFHLPADGPVVDEERGVPSSVERPRSSVNALGGFVEQDLAGLNVDLDRLAVETFDRNRVRLVDVSVDVDDARHHVRLYPVGVHRQRVALTVKPQSVSVRRQERNARPRLEQRFEVAHDLVLEPSDVDEVRDRTRNLVDATLGPDSVILTKSLVKRLVEPFVDVCRSWNDGVADVGKVRDHVGHRDVHQAVPLLLRIFDALDLFESILLPSPPKRRFRNPLAPLTKSSPEEGQ